MPEEQTTLLTVEKFLESTEGVTPTAYLILPFELRQKSRQRATLSNGQEIGLFLPRGTVLRDGNWLEAEDGLIIEVKAAPEQVSVAKTHDRLLMLRACYHLGNRHVPLQICEQQASYLHDRVLDDMVKGLGLELSIETIPFEPESGAYHSHGGGGHHHH